MKLLDTTFLIDLLRGKKETAKLLNGKEVLVTTQTNMYELIKGLFLKNVSSSKFKEVIDMFDNIRVLPFDDNAVIKSADIYSEFIKKGKKIHNFDCIIAGIALSNGITNIVTKNVKHFNRISGIKVEHY